MESISVFLASCHLFLFFFVPVFFLNFFIDSRLNKLSINKEDREKEWDNIGRIAMNNGFPKESMKKLRKKLEELTETSRRIIKTFKQYNFFNVLFLIE